LEFNIISVKVVNKNMFFLPKTKAKNQSQWLMFSGRM
jgi:hypothetical protein